METEEQVPHPPIVSREEWNAARMKLLAEEKELTKHHDRVSASRRRLPMVAVDKQYVFEGADGNKTLLELFDGKRILVVYHFMFDPAWQGGCLGCTWFLNSIAPVTLQTLDEAGVSFSAVSRAEYPKLEAWKKEHGWTMNWVSSHDSDFNYDYHVSFDESKAPIEYNYMTKEEIIAKEGKASDGESHGVSVFFRVGDKVYHTYSCYARGVENLVSLAGMAEATPYGRQEDWEDSPEGWPQRPTYG